MTHWKNSTLEMGDERVAAFVGVDIGTTSTKVIAYDPDGTLLAEESGGMPCARPDPDGPSRTRMRS